RSACRGRGRLLGRPGGGRRLGDLALGLAPPALFLLLAGEQPGRGLLGAPARLLLGPLARLFLGLPLGRGLLLGALARRLFGQPLGVGLRAAAGVLLGALGIGERAHPGALLLFGQRLQHHATARGALLTRGGHGSGRLGAGAQRLVGARGSAARRLGPRPAHARRLQLALALDLDRNRLAAPVREALAHHAAVLGLGQLEPASRSRERDPRIALLLLGVGCGGLGVGHVPYDRILPQSDAFCVAAGSSTTLARNPARRRA